MNKLEENFKNWIRWNSSTLFLLKPITGVSISHMSEFGLINTFLKDEENDEYEGDYLFVLLKPADFDFLEILIHEQSREVKAFVDDYDYEGGFVVLVYIIPPEFKEDFEKFKKGEYSKMSDAFKALHDGVVLINGKKEETLQHMVFYKSEKFKRDVEEFFDFTFSKEDELWEKPLIKKETLSIETYNIKELV